MGVVTSMFSTLEELDEFRRWAELTRSASRDKTDRGLITNAATFLLQPEQIRECELLWISSDMVDLLRHAARTLPPFPFDPGLLLWPKAIVTAAKPLFTTIDPDDGEVMPVPVILWTDIIRRTMPDQPVHTILMGFGHSAQVAEIAPLLYVSLVPGKVIGNDQPEPFTGAGLHTPSEDKVDGYSRVLCTLWLLLLQKVAVVRRVGGDRADRRRWGRDHDGPIPEVTVVELRRPLHTEPHENTPVGFVDWSHRWIVDGHWRNQYHPSTGDHVPTWIAPYVKGPEDKPLVVKRKVNAWVR